LLRAGTRSVFAEAAWQAMLQAVPAHAARHDASSHGAPPALQPASEDSRSIYMGRFRQECCRCRRYAACPPAELPPGLRAAAFSA